ncbi:MAG: ribosome-associated translation inhibitor RaiA [Gammaproteobacteria bacterium]|nr:ribosome-associated translation inhibitor RaiA [Gammaproteobacteria bacterium]
MQIEIQARDFSLTNALRDYIKRRLDFALRRRDNHIQRVMVRVSDINGPRGGQDKSCQIHIVLPKASVVVEDIKSNLYKAIDRAAGRARQSIDRHLTRRRKKSRAPGVTDLITVDM